MDSRSQILLDPEAYDWRAGIDECYWEKGKKARLRQKQILKRNGNDFLQSRRERTARGIIPRLMKVLASCKKNQKTVKELKR